MPSTDSISSDATQTSAKNGLNLPWIALEAAEQTLVTGGRIALPEERGERMKALIGSKIGDGVSKYFKEVKWIFVLDRTLYERYLVELSSIINGDMNALTSVCIAHANPALVTL